MKKLLYILAGLGLAACTSDIEELPEVGPQPGREVALTGISGTASRTQFVPGDGTEIQFQWSTGDRIWAGGVQSAEAGTDGNVADFGFTNLPGDAPYRIYYNMTGTDAEAVVPTEQRQAEPGKLQLGPNGDFGYATTDSEGRFTLSHATAYVWFNPWSQDVKEKLVSVTLAATDASTVLTGTRTFDGTGFSDATDANNAVTLSFGKEGVELPATSSTASVFAAAVVYPADCSAEEIHVTYTFADGSVYTETKTGRNFEAERFDGDVSLATLPAIKDFGEFLPALKAISGDLSIDDLSSLEGVLDLSGCTFSPNSTLDLRLVAATRLTELRGGDFGGSLRIDASSLTPQPEAMPFGITGFKNLDTLRIAGFTHVSELSLPTESCDDLTIENCGSQAPFTLSLPNLVEVRGTLLCRNCGKAGEANSASFPRLKNVGRQLSFYVGASSFTVLEFPLLETVGNGEPVSDDPADDYALYTMPSGCAGEFILPSLQRVNGSMLVSTWNTSTDRAVAFRFPSLQSVAGEISVGHTAYKNRSVATLDFSALTAAGAIRIGNLSSVTDFSTFTQVLPRLSEQTWSVTDCSYNPTYQQMLDGETGAESK